MGIYIKGMEMPRRGMVVNIYGDGRVTNHFDEFCKTIGKAVPVPPHGRLIDADELQRQFERMANEEWNKNIAVSAASCFDDAAVIVEDAPTIIEAEEES